MSHGNRRAASSSSRYGSRLTRRSAWAKVQSVTTKCGYEAPRHRAIHCPLPCLRSTRCHRKWPPRRTARHAQTPARSLDRQSLHAVDVGGQVTRGGRSSASHSLRTEIKTKRARVRRLEGQLREARSDLEKLGASPKNPSSSRSTVLLADPGVEKPFNTRSIRRVGRARAARCLDRASGRIAY